MMSGKFIGQLFQSANIMHIAHLQTTSFAEHKALNQYYDGITELADKFTEVYFGRSKRCEIIIPEAKNMSSVDHLKEMQSLVDGERSNYSSELQNIIDEILALINKTLYLLTLV